MTMTENEIDEQARREIYDEDRAELERRVEERKQAIRNKLMLHIAGQKIHERNLRERREQELADGLQENLHSA
jgi:hypothetical protein